MSGSRGEKASNDNIWGSELPSDPSRKNKNRQNILLQHVDSAENHACSGSQDDIIGKQDLQTIARDAEPHLGQVAQQPFDNKNFSGPMNIYGAKSGDIGFSKQSIKDNRRA